MLDASLLAGVAVDDTSLLVDVADSDDEEDEDISLLLAVGLSVDED